MNATKPRERDNEATAAQELAREDKGSRRLAKARLNAREERGRGAAKWAQRGGGKGGASNA